MSFFVYILRCNDGTLYAGSTNDIVRRLYQHNNLKSGATYTKGRRPVVLIYVEIFKTLRKAKQREYAVKCLTREEKFKLIED